MRSSRETRISNCICAALVLLAGCARLLLRGTSYTYNGLIFALFTAAGLIWICQLQRRLLQSDVRRNLIAAAVMMIFWMLLRTIKYEFLSGDHFTERYTWYLYYAPMLLIPLLMFLSVLYVGRDPDRPISQRWKLLYIPSGALILGVLTNDLHQLAFRFPDGVAGWNDANCIRGPVYYAAMAWMAALFLSMLVIVFVRCAVPANRKKIWMPLLPLLIGALYILCIILNLESYVTRLLTVPEMGCFLFAVFMECLILAHLLPSNDRYGDFWNASSIGAGIMDRAGVIRYRSERSLPVTPEQVREAVSRPVLLQNGGVILNSRAVQGGFGYWTKDISELNRLNDALKDLGDVRAEENSMLEAENEMAADKVRVEQQNLLYNGIAKSVRPQLADLDKLLDTLPEDEEAFEQAMKYACVLNAYIKRRSNLLLLSRQSREIPSDELCRALSESLEYVRLCGLMAYAEYGGQGVFPCEVLLLAYEVFEAALEAALPGADTVLVDLKCADSGLKLRMELNAPRENLPEDFMSGKIAALHGTLERETDQQTESITLFLPTGGERP